MTTKIMNFIKTTLIIIRSRFKNDIVDEVVEQKRAICKTCNYNSLNMQSVPPLKKFLKWLSDLYSKITGNAKVDVLGNCHACEACSILFKSRDEEECPHPDGDKWKNINR